MSQIPAVLQQLYLKNIEFFKKQNPSIHAVITNTQPDHSKIIINKAGKVDLAYNGKYIYGGDAIDYVEREVEEFKGFFSKPFRVSPFNIIKPGDYCAPRFFHQHLNETVTILHESAKDTLQNKIYHNQRFDLLIVTGIGLGLHISEILDRLDVQNILILETDYELLTLSCFFTDWDEIYKKQNTKDKKSISLLLMDKHSLENENSSLWNELIKRAPQFPYNTVFYNHGRHDKYGEIIRKINADITMYMSLWGFYDDEKNQLNHIFHNIKNNTKLIPKKADFKWNKPVIICGSGPSLDDRIHQLKSIRDNCILITAGTSLAPILNNGLTPDFHIEIESNYIVKNALIDIKRPDELKKITLICALQCSPYVLELFGNAIAFVKDSMSIGDILQDRKDHLRESTPTCVNAAFSFAFHYNAPKIILFGTDFGFYDREKHHSKHTIYNNSSETTESIVKSNNENMDRHFKQKGYKGECLTTNLYYTTKRRLDTGINLLRSKNMLPSILNCSDGLIIEHTEHIESNDTITIPTTNEDTNKIFYDMAQDTNERLLNKITNIVVPTLENLSKILILNLDKMDNNIENLSSTCWAFSNYINTTFKDENKNIYYLIRGTIWHYMLGGYSIAYSCPPDDQENLIKIWKYRFIDFLNKLPTDLKDELNKDRSIMENDPYLRKTLLDE